MNWRKSYFTFSFMDVRLVKFGCCGLRPVLLVKMWANSRPS